MIRHCNTDKILFNLLSAMDAYMRPAKAICMNTSHQQGRWTHICVVQFFLVFHAILLHVTLCRYILFALDVQNHQRIIFGIRGLSSKHCKRSSRLNRDKHGVADILTKTRKCPLTYGRSVCVFLSNSNKERHDETNSLSVDRFLISFLAGKLPTQIYFKNL